MTKYEALVTALGAQLPLAHFSARVWQDPWVEGRVLHLAAVTNILPWMILAFMPTLRTRPSQLRNGTTDGGLKNTLLQ